MSTCTTAPSALPEPPPDQAEWPPVTTADLRAARVARGLRQCDVAVAIGCSPSHYAKIERGVQLPSVEQLAGLAGIFGLERLYRDLAPFVHRAAS